MILQRPLYASDDDESDNDAETTEFSRSLYDHRNHLDTDAESDNDDEMMNPYIMKPSFQSLKEHSRNNLDSAALLPPSMELTNVTATQRRQPQSSHLNQGQPLDVFDPYGPTWKIGRKSFDDMQLEMEEESIDFMSASSIKQSAYKPKFTMFGPLVHEQQSPEERREEGGFEDGESSFIDSTSFSPVSPKHHTTQRQTHYSSNAEYGEAMPLSGNPSAGRRRKHQYYHGQGALGTMRVLGGDMLSWITGDHGHRNPFSQSSYNRLNVGGTNTSSRRHYNRVAYLRLFVVLLATLFALSTMTMMKHMLFSEIDTSSTVIKYQEEAEADTSARSNGKPDSVLKKIQNAKLKAKEKKQHWWSRNEDVKDKSGLETVESNETQGDNSKRYNQAQGVVVESAEDGTLLIKLPPPNIKLPPPKMHLEQPSPQGDLTTSKVTTSKEEQQDETVLRKRRTLSEKSDSSKKLKFSSPPPFMEHTKKRHNQSFHFHEIDQEPSVLESLRSEFDSWTAQHKKTYSSHNEKEHRFQIWRISHHRIQKKNQRHGPCRMTGKAVFGHGPFSDLRPDEFREKYLTGYHGPRFHKQKKQGEAPQASKTMRGISPSRRTTGEITPPAVGSVKRHPSIQRRLDELVGGKYQASFVSGCRSWIDVACMLKKIFGYSVYGGTREPVYDENSYPSSMDWRAMGIVSSVHSQSTCGACWAITAVETIESAYAMSTGKLIDLAEEEVIACDGTCEMCNGGWPQNAYDYVMKHGGIPKKSNSYDADFLLTLTSVINEGSDALSEYETSSYFGKICPTGSREGGGDSQSGDNQYGTDSFATRYGNIKGYGYASEYFSLDC